MKMIAFGQVQITQKKDKKFVNFGCNWVKKKEDHL